MIETEIELGRVQLAIEYLVKKQCISMKEWNLKPERVEKILGRLLRQRDTLLSKDRATQAGTTHIGLVRE